MRQLTGLAVLTGASLVVACAAQAPAIPTAAGGDHETVAAAASAVPPTTPAAARVASPTSTSQTASVISQSASAALRQSDSTTDGYDRVVVHGKQLFCRTESISGSRMKQRVCLTEAQLQAQREAARQYLETLQRDSGVAGAVNPLGPLMGGPMGGR